MKSFCFQIDSRQCDLLFSPIRSKTDLCETLLESMKLMLINEEIDDQIVAGEFKLVVSKMSRIFFQSENKIFSITFPFTVIGENEDDIEFRWGNEIPIDNRIISILLGFLRHQHAFNANSLDAFYECVSENIDLIDWFWDLLKILMFSEDGYLRYDHDPVHENGRLHPLHHIDMFYHSGNAFKVGLEQGLDTLDMIDLLNTSTDCLYIATQE